MAWWGLWWAVAGCGMVGQGRDHFAEVGRCATMHVGNARNAVTLAENGISRLSM